MSRLGKNPVIIPDNVDVVVNDNILTAKGKLGENTVHIMQGIHVDVHDKSIKVTPQNTTKEQKIAWGATRQLIQNAVKGVSDGFTRKLEINGVGYRAIVQGSILKLSLGYSHDIDFAIPSDISIAIEGDKKNVIVVAGYNKQRVGQVASNIKDFRRPEPYKGKGVKYLEERILRKESKKK